MKTKNDADCSIYSSLSNGNPEDGICTCGYGHQLVGKGRGDYSEMYSKELWEKIRKERGIEESVSDEEFYEEMKKIGLRVKGDENDNRN